MNVQNKIQDSKTLEAKALETCNSEPIHTPGYIQNHGALVAFNFDTLDIAYVSENITDYLDVDVKTVFDLSIRDLLTREDFHDISNIASHKTTFNQREQVKTTVLNSKKIDVSLFRVTNYVVIELMPTLSVAAYSNNSHLKWTLDTINKLDNAHDILKLAVNTLRNITQFDRVKAYMFHPDNSGEVVAEQNNGKMESFLGLHFPAADIPPIARQIFSKITIRYIKNANNRGVKLLAAKHLKETPLNITLGILRGNSPVHNQYLRNMGVSSTLSLPIIVKGKLWGLFSLHHETILNLPAEILYTSELIGQIVSMVLAQKIQQNAELKLKKLYFNGNEFITLNQNALYLQKFWKAYADKLKSLVTCSGVCYQIDDKILVYKSCPSRNAILSVAEEISKQPELNTFHTSNLTTISKEDFGSTRGILALCIHQDNPKINIYFFRDAIEQEITWAGNPKKDIEFTKENVRLHPRSSFNAFKQIYKEQSKPWDSETLNLAEIATQTFKKAVTIEKATTARLDTVVRELNHRLRNILALVRSISKQTANDSVTIENYVNALEQRILALAKANNLLTDSIYNAVDIKAIFETIILSLCDRPQQLSFDGDPTKITTEVTSMLVLIIHELTTNAIKYGAFSVPKGRVAIKWYLEPEGLIIEWKELNGPKVTTPTTHGFGTNIIENAIKYEFDGRSKIHYDEDGIFVKFMIPTNLIGEHKAPIFVLNQVEEANLPKTPKKVSILNVLILEDDFLNAQDLQHVISALPVNDVHAFSNQNEALKALETHKYHLALLDVNLKKETCISIALTCQEKNIPFYYITGYGSSFLEGNGFPKAPVVLKPISTKKITDIVSRYISNLTNET